jgi:PleD family two-component response regulator
MAKHHLIHILITSIGMKFLLSASQLDRMNFLRIGESVGGLEYQLRKDIRVLLVDDEEDQIELAKLNLEKMDSSFKVTGVHTPTEAMSLLQTLKPDCVVSDYLMPEMDGIQLYSSIKDFDVPYILYTG